MLIYITQRQFIVEMYEYGVTPNSPRSGEVMSMLSDFKAVFLLNLSGVSRDTTVLETYVSHGVANRLRGVSKVCTLYQAHRHLMCVWYSMYLSIALFTSFSDSCFTLIIIHSQMIFKML